MVRRLFTAIFLISSALCGAAQAKLVVIAPHPDDAEASCGGTIINTVESGEEVVILQMTGGEKGIIYMKPQQAKAARAKEADNSAKLLGVGLERFGAVDAELEVTIANTAKLKDELVRLQPDVVLAPWPMDVHNDHQATGLLAWRVFLDMNSNFDLYFYETSNGPHTKTFQFVPTHYVDITNSFEKKKEALMKHKSQAPGAWFDMYELINRFRGYESDVALAEGYIHARPSAGHGGRSGKALPKLKKED
jgi:LmbE family N-acetylglucosaminyl deacetylase